MNWECFLYDVVFFDKNSFLYSSNLYKIVHVVLRIFVCGDLFSSLFKGKHGPEKLEKS